MNPMEIYSIIPNTADLISCTRIPEARLPQTIPTSFPEFSPTRPSERERETLENAGHVSPRIWEIKNKRFGGGAGKFEICLYTA